jgi:hypothetical protein
VLVDWDQPKIPLWSTPPTLHASHLPSTLSAGQIVPVAENTSNAHLVGALEVPFVLEGLFGEADAEAMDPEPREDVGTQIDDAPNPCKRVYSPAGDGADIIGSRAQRGYAKLPCAARCCLQRPSPCAADGRRGGSGQLS